MITLLLATSVLSSPVGCSVDERLDQALDLVPETAEVIAVVPDLRRANDDLGQLIDAMGRPSTVLAGRPIEMFKAQLGIGSGLDELGFAVMYLAGEVDELGEPVPVYLAPTNDPAAFVRSNFAGATELEPGLQVMAGEERSYFRLLEKHVLITTSEALARSHRSDTGMAAIFNEEGDPAAGVHLERTDLIVWSRRDAFEGLMGSLADRAPMGVPIGDPAAIGGMTADLLYGLLLCDFDPLGLSIRSFMEWMPGSTMAGFMEGGEGDGPMLGRLPDNPYYFAMSIDFAGLGGHAAFRNLMGLASMPLDVLPEGIREGRLGLKQLQLAAYPSRLGIALGGLLNDSALVVSADDPEAVKEAFRTFLMSLEGDRGGIRYQPEWVTDKPLRTGGVADAFRLQETVLPPTGDAPQGGFAGSAIQRIALQLIYGSRGLSGFTGTEGTDAFVMTFSQRPDVWKRALGSATGTGTTLADSPVLRSMRPWLIEQPDFELLIGMGTLTKLFEQLSRTLPVIDPEMIPDIPPSTPPIAFDLSADSGLFETATVIPTGVIALVFDQVMEGLMQGFGGGPIDQ